MSYLYFLSYARANRTPGVVEDELSRFVDDLREEERHAEAEIIRDFGDA